MTLAAAAVLALVLLLQPTRVNDGLPRPVDGAALVAAPRLGETPGVTHELAAGRLVLPGGF